MIAFEQLMDDVRALSGKRLRSISGRSDLILLEVDDANQRVTVKDLRGRKKTRPFSQFRAIWAALCTTPAVHVDSVLGGSSSSRNQPETIMANLPYVEWLKVKGKKHLALVGEVTHPAGELREMDPARAEEVRRKLAEAQDESPEYRALLVVDDVVRATRALEEATGIPVNALDQGAYYHKASGILVLSEGWGSSLRAGTYVVVPQGHLTNGATTVEVNGQRIHLVPREGFGLAVPE